MESEPYSFTTTFDDQDEPVSVEANYVQRKRTGDRYRLYDKILLNDKDKLNYDRNSDLYNLVPTGSLKTKVLRTRR